jgi:hypothetical protein
VQSTSCYLTHGIYCNELKTGLLYVYIYRYHARPFITLSVRAPKTGRSIYNTNTNISECLCNVNKYMNWSCQRVCVCVSWSYQRVRRTHYSRLYKLGYSSNRNHTRKRFWYHNVFVLCNCQTYVSVLRCR